MSALDRGGDANGWPILWATQDVIPARRFAEMAQIKVSQGDEKGAAFYAAAAVSRSRPGPERPA